MTFRELDVRSALDKIFRYTIFDGTSTICSHVPFAESHPEFQHLIRVDWLAKYRQWSISIPILLLKKYLMVMTSEYSEFIVKVVTSQLWWLLQPRCYTQRLLERDDTMDDEDAPEPSTEPVFDVDRG